MLQTKIQSRWLTLVIASIFSLLFVVGGNDTYAHGPSPSNCPNLYDSVFTSIIIQSQGLIFNPVLTPGVVIPVQIGVGYELNHTLHTSVVSNSANTQLGSTWFWTSNNGYQSNNCVYDVGPNEDISFPTHTVNSFFPDGTLRVASWGTSINGKETSAPGQTTYFYLYQAGPVASSLTDAPRNLSAYAISSSRIDLRWDEPIINFQQDTIVPGYKIERSNNGGVTWETIVSDTNSSFNAYSDTGLAHSTTYFYRVSKVTLGVSGSPSNWAGATTFNTVPASLSIQLGDQLPEGIEVNPNTNKIYVSSPAKLASSCCPPNDKLFVIDGSNDNILVNVTVGWDSHNVAVNPNTNKIYVPGRDSSCRSCAPSNSSVHVIDGTTDEVVSKVGVDGNLWGIGVNPNTNKVYVSNTDFDSVHIIDGTTNSIFDTISLESEPRGIAINPNTNKIYVALAPINKTAVIDGSTNSIIATIPVGDMPLDIAINPNTNKIYVANYGSRSCSIVSCQDPSSIGSTVSVIDGLTNSVTNIIQVGRGPYSIAIDPSTSRVYVTNYFDNTISIIDGNTDSVVDTVPVGSVPNGVGVNPNTNKIYVSNYADRSVTIIGSPALATLSVGTVDKLGNTLEGIWMQLASADGTIIDAGFTPISFEVIQGEQYTVLANNYNQHQFLHWEDGSMDSSRDVTPTEDITMTATYTITTVDQILP